MRKVRAKTEKMAATVVRVQAAWMDVMVLMENLEKTAHQRIGRNVRLDKIVIQISV